MTAQNDRDTSVSHDDEESIENNSQPADMSILLDSFGGATDSDDGDDAPKDAETDFTQQFGADEDTREEINANLDVMERLDEIIENEDGIDDASGPHRVAAEFEDDDIDDEHVSDIIEQEYEVENGTAVGRMSAVEKATNAKANGAGLPWDDITKLYDDNNGDLGRWHAANRLDQEHSWMFVRSEEQDLEELRWYDPEEGIYVGGGEYRVTQLLDKHLKQHATQHEANEVTAKLKARNETPLATTNAGDRELRCVENGVLDLRSMDLLEHDPDYRFTRKLNARWDTGVDTSEVREFVRDITKHERDALVLEEMFGDCLAPHYDRQWFGVLYGDGANGKSVALNCLRTVLGSENVAAESLHDIAETRWSGASIAGEYGSLANIDPDIEARKIHDAAPIKNLTGGDATSMERKGRDKFDATNTAKMLFAANKPAIFAERVNAIVRRIKPLELPYTFKPESEIGESSPNAWKPRDPKIQERLTTDDARAAWLQVMADALCRLRDNNGFCYEETQQELFDEYQAEADTLWSFQKSCIQNLRVQYTDNDAAVYLTVEELHSMYASYCQERDERAMDQAAFARELNKTGLHEMETFYPNRTGQVAARKFLTPTEEGWEYARTSTRKRFELHVDEVEVPNLETTDDDDGSDDAESEGEEVSRLEQLCEDIEMLESPRAKLDATVPHLLTESNVDWDDDEELVAALAVLEHRGRIEKDADGVYHVTGGDAE